MNMTYRQPEAYTPLRPKLLLQLASPHTWPASIYPVLFSIAYANLAVARYSDDNFAVLRPVMMIVLLAICVLFQSAVNVINDYIDFRKGSDTRENQDDPTDAVLVYNNVNPRSVLFYFLCLVACAFLLGLYCIKHAGFFPLAIALVGVVVILAYSGGKTPISYMPIGEAVSGFTMGYLIPLAAIVCLLAQVPMPDDTQLIALAIPSRMLSFFGSVLLLSLPVVASIALIMFTNNGCDIEKDRQSGRRTLAVVLGAQRTKTAYHVLMLIWVGCIVLDVLLASWRLWPLLIFALLLSAPFFLRLWSSPLSSQTRGLAFSHCMSLNIALNTLYIMCLFAAATL